MKKPLPKIVRRRSSVHGYGVFAAEPIAKNTRIIDYAGELVQNRDSTAREERYLAATFGAEYERYRAEVPRFVGRRAGGAGRGSRVEGDA